MRAFLIHRTSMRSEANNFLHSLRQTDGIFIEPDILKKSFGSKWQRQAEDRILSAEVAIIFDSDACAQSENTTWEIERAKQLGKAIIELSREDIQERNIGALQSAYNFSSEFENCFEADPGNQEQILELYKIMVSSSEQLIQRRQITNGFFITVIGAMIGASGLILKEGLLSDTTLLAIVFPLAISLLLCKSWQNLIENYGKLNKGKFQVIHRIEEMLGARVFEAEWIALGRGIRKEKYRSFTDTEQNVPRLFSYLLWSAMILVFISADWKEIMDSVLGSFATVVDAVSNFATSTSQETD